MLVLAREVQNFLAGLDDRVLQINDAAGHNPLLRSCQFQYSMARSLPYN